MYRFATRRLLPFAAAGALAAPCLAGVASYQGTFGALNNSGVSGTVDLTMNGDTLTVMINATGLQPNEVHPQHIHGLKPGGNAACPTLADDTNGDGFISVVEGAAPYGPIKVNLTNPPTPFGPSPNPLLFAPYAGTPNNADFPMADASGAVHFTETITFDPSKSADAQALAAITPLDKQHVVLHGMTAPESVDTPGGNPMKMIYDPLLPVACAELAAVSSPGPSAVPLPAAFWPATAMLGLLAGAGLLRRRAAPR